jgi:hypothetical protein
VLRPPLKWAGGKRWQVPHLEPLWRAHAHRRLVEPFCGGLAVTLGLQPQRALLNDINPHLINFYEWLKRGLHVDIALDIALDMAAPCGSVRETRRVSSVTSAVTASLQNHV